MSVPLDSLGAMVSPTPRPPRPPRLYIAEDILSGKVRLDNYPFRYICIGPGVGTALSAGFGGRSGANAMLDQILSAAELLESRGWELVNVDQGGTVACLRRR